MRILILTALFTASLCGHSQEKFSLEDFLTLVYENHPVAKQAGMVRERADWERRGGKGNLDPKLVSSFQTKDFKEKDYYDLWNSYLEIPTPINVDLKAGYERNTGYRLNPQNTVPSDGLYYAGISVPVGRGLLLNERIYQRKAGLLKGEELKIEADQIINNLLLDACYSYWRWVEASKKASVYRRALGTVQIRFEGVKEAVINGDKAAIDTTESLIQLQQLSNDLSKATLDSANQSLTLQNFIWMTDVQLILPSGIPLEPLRELSYYETFALQNHPDLRFIDNKDDQLVNDKKFYREQVKPQLDLSYNLLLENGSNKEFNTNDYKAGVSFSVPLLLRKERSKLKIAKLKLRENELKSKQKTQEIINKIRANFNKTVITNDLLTRQIAMTTNYEVMLNGERQKLANGESSIFLVNSRLNKYLQARIKEIELQIDYQQYLNTLLWSSASIIELIK